MLYSWLLFGFRYNVNLTVKNDIINKQDKLYKIVIIDGYFINDVEQCYNYLNNYNVNTDNRNKK